MINTNALQKNKINNSNKNKTESININKIILFLFLHHIYYRLTMHAWRCCVLSQNTRSVEQKMAIVICRIKKKKCWTFLKYSCNLLHQFPLHTTLGGKNKFFSIWSNYIFKKFNISSLNRYLLLAFSVPGIWDVSVIWGKIL